MANYVVLIPSYNTGARLFQTVATIRQQGHPVWVVIDGSTDGTGDELSRIAATDSDLQVFVLPRNRGKGAAVLHALRIADTQGITSHFNYLHDNILLGFMYARLLTELTAHLTASLVRRVKSCRGRPP